MNRTQGRYPATQASTVSLVYTGLGNLPWVSVLTWLLAFILITTAVAQPPPPPVSPIRTKPPVAGQPATGKPAAGQPTASKSRAMLPPPPASPAAPKPNAMAPVRPAAPAKAVTSQTPVRAGKDKSKMTVTNPELVTKDGVALRTFYFASDRGKEAIPVIICHEWQGQASPYAGLVKSLWEAGCAVIVPEFRGHGGSREFEVGGKKREFDTARMSRNDVSNIIGRDMEAVKKFLREENNAGKLNLNALVLVGIREGAVIASQWAVTDWNFPSVGSRKQGQDVKALALVSPSKILKGVSLDETLQDRYLWQLPFLIVVGESSPEFGDADRFFKRLDAMKKRAGKGTTDGLKFEVVPTSLSGPALVNEAPGVVEKISGFVKTEIVDNSAKFPWIERE